MNRKQFVYLSGGLNTSNWQEMIIERFEKQFVFYNPRYHNLNEPNEYTTWDLHFVKQCDILFAYMEKHNPSGFGLTLEIGLALGLNKTIILVDEKSKNDIVFEPYFLIVRNASTIVFNELEKGIDFLSTFGTYN
jgi:hypothetical protein